VESDLASLSLSLFKLKNRHWWNSGEKYHRIEYCIKVTFGPADINFELWHEGVKLSKDNAISVEWHKAQAPDPRAQEVRPDLPISLSTVMGPGTMNLSLQRSKSPPVQNLPIEYAPQQTPTRRPVPVEMPNSMVKTQPVTMATYELA
jgi:hypothetical protein